MEHNMGNSDRTSNSDSAGITEADIERGRLRARLDDLDSEIWRTGARIDALRSELADLEDKRSCLQHDYDATWDDYNELGGFHIEAVAAEHQAD